MKRIISIALVLVGCQMNEVKQIENQVIQSTDKQVDMSDDLLRVTDSLLGLHGLVDIQKIDKRIQVDLKYASNDNFMNSVLYDTLRKAYLQKEVAVRLSLVQSYLDSLKPGYRLVVYDAVRPVQVQREMWEALDTVPVYRRGKFVSNPALGSVHNFGAAVDVTIVNDKGILLDMGAGYDDFRAIAFPSREVEFLKTGELNREQYENRKLLRKVMHSQKFRNIPSEWWHFNAFSRIIASHKYQLLRTESGLFEAFVIEPKKSNQEDSLIAPSIEPTILDSLSKTK